MSLEPIVLLPDFVLIALGFAICRWTPLDRPLWDAVERLVYLVLFPALLLHAIVRRPMTLADIAGVGAWGAAVVGLGIVLAFALARWPGVDGRLHASGAQVAFRFNTYVGLAVAERLGGSAGVATMAVIVAVCVPIANVAAVLPLARHGSQSLLRELARNPLLVATAVGLVANLLGLRPPAPAMEVLQRMAQAALPLGLMAVGAGLRFGALREGPGLAAALLAIRHAVLPLAAIAAMRWAQPAPLVQAIVVAFAAMPTASSAYVLAVRMGGHGGYAAGLVTVSTLLSLASLPLALAIWQHVAR